MEAFSDYDQYDALGLAELIRSGQTTSQELVEACIERVWAHNPKVNAVVRPLYDLGRAAAEEPLPESPLAGIPFLMKDLIQCIPGVPTESGCVFWKGWTPTVETNLYKRWRKAGIIPIAKTATSELGLLPVTETDLCGVTRNPWDLNRTPGGSSGGAGASVAAGMVPMASGTDGGGSIRIPASCCGLFWAQAITRSKSRGPHRKRALVWISVRACPQS